MAPKVKDIAEEILNHLHEKEERKLPWLSNKTGISYGHLYSVLVKKERRLTEDNLKKINNALKTNFKL